ncbi:MAG: D-tyrosyl-tRNA(Tyr) deacylase [Kiritimatiellia bacterium]|jgi:D-tyrosyl-tRNA(Tyr) deacylase
MRALIQRVTQASVSVDQQVVGHIDQGLLLLLGVQKNDTQQQADKLLQKIINYRVFSDTDGKMNLSLLDMTGGLLIVSQFTLAADTKKGLRPGFSSAAEPEVARNLYDYFVVQARKESIKENVQTGVFAADMQVALVNDGPVTFLLET